MLPLPFVALLADPAAPHVAAVRTGDKITLDGKLDEAAWRAAPPDDRFTQKMPDGGKKPSERTTVRVLYDDHDVYVGVACTQEKAAVIARLARRDHPTEADSVTVGLGTRADGKSAFEFQVNAAGVLSDAIRYNDTDISQDWDENWEARAARTSTGWSAEFKIPLRILRFEGAAAQSWGLQVRRYTSQRQETDEWAFIPRDAAGEVSRYGRLDGLVGIRPKSTIELRPFVVATLQHLDPHGYIPGTDYDYLKGRGFSFKPSAGLDLKWHLTQALTVDAAFNPDFGQIEQDAVVLNLTTFETFYPEKRPFFLEGIDGFATPLQLLYTRRIGRAPDLPVLRSGGPFYEHAVELPGPASIYGAAKLTGDLGGGFSTSQLIALTGQDSVDVGVRGGAPTARAVLPLTVFKVSRFMKELGPDARVAVTAMSTNRLESVEDYPRLPRAWSPTPAVLCPFYDYQTAAPNQRCFHDAYVGGFDGKWRPGGGDWVATAQVVGTLIHDGPPREQADGVIIKSGDAAPVVYANVAKDAGKHWVGNVQYDFHGLRADYNDLGYMQRQNQHHGDANLEYRTLEPWKAFNETHTWVELVERDNLAGLPLGRVLMLGSYVKYANFWSSYALARGAWAYDDDREVGDGTALERQATGGFEAGITSDSRVRVHGNLWTQTLFYKTGQLTQGQLDLALDVLPQWELALSPAWFFTHGEPRFAGFQDDVLLFGRQRGENASLTLRTTYTFTPRLTLQAYAQLFVAAVHYDDITSAPAQCSGPSAPCLHGDAASRVVVHLGDLQPFAGAVASSPDFTEATINANVVLRWEYRLGSTLYLVYTHGQDRTISTLYGSRPAVVDLALLRPQPASEAVAVKFSYWWSSG